MDMQQLDEKEQVKWEDMQGIDLELLMNSSIEEIKELLKGRKFILSISGLDNMGKSTQAKLLGERYPEIFSQPLHINQSPSFPQLKGKELSHWWFDPNNMENFARTMYKALAERKEAALQSDFPIVVLDKGIDFYDERVKATLLTLGMPDDQVAELIVKIKTELGLHNSYEDMKIMIVPPKGSTRSNVREEEKNDLEDVYERYMKKNVELINKKINEGKVFTPVEFVEGDIRTIHLDILAHVADVVERRTQRTKVEQIRKEAEEFFGDNLKMLVLAGSAGKGKFMDGWSDIDMYYFFDKLDYDKLSQYSEMLGKYGVHVGPTYYTTRDLANVTLDARTVHVLLELERGKDKVLINKGVDIPRVSLEYAAQVDKGDIPDALNKLKRELLHKNSNPNKDNTRDKKDDGSQAKMPYDTAKIIKILSLLHKLILKSLDEPIIPNGYADTFEAFGRVYGEKLKARAAEYLSKNDVENARKCEALCDILNGIDIVEVIKNRHTYENCEVMYNYGMAVLYALDEGGYDNNMEVMLCQNESAAELS